jgi:hypothetical protein
MFEVEGNREDAEDAKRRRGGRRRRGQPETRGVLVSAQMLTARAAPLS